MLSRSILFAGTLAACFSIAITVAADLDDHNCLVVRMLSFVFFVACGAAAVRFELSHPFVWFNIPFALYSLAAPTLYLIGSGPYLETYARAVALEFLAVLFFSFGAGLTTRHFRDLSYDSLSRLVQGNTPFFVASLVLALASIGYHLLSGVSSRYEKVLDFSPLYAVDFVYFFLNISICILVIEHLRARNRLNRIQLVAFSAFVLLSFLISGHRNIIFRLFIMLVMCYDILYKRIPKGVLLAVTSLGIYLSTVANHFKMYFLSAQAGELSLDFSWSGIVTTMLGSELRTPGENLARVLRFVPAEIPYFFGETLVWDLKRALVPGFLFPRGVFVNTSSWFTMTFFPGVWERGGGVGFTMVGTSYINFGVVGIAVLFLLLGVGLRLVYSRATKRVTWLVFYLNLIPIVIYSMRSDISVLISQSLKHTAFPLALILLLSLFLPNNRQVHRGARGT